MTVQRINDDTIRCIIPPEDLQARGIRIDDFFARTEEAVDFIRSVVAEAAVSEDFDMEGKMMTMQVSVMPDHSLSLLITREDSREGLARHMRRIAQGIFETLAAHALAEDENGEEEGGQAQDVMGALLSEMSEEAVSGADGGKMQEDGPADAEPGGGREGKGKGKGAKKEKKTQDAYMFSFYSMREVMDCCKVFGDGSQVDSSLYYLKEDEIYFLILRRNDRTPKGFERRLVAGNEFGELVTSHEQYISFVEEHGVCIAGEHAIEMCMDVMPGLKLPRTRGK